MADWVMPLFTIVVAVALLVETLAIAAMYFGVRSLVRRMDSAAESLQRRVYPVISQVQVRLDELQPKISSAIDEAAYMVHTARMQTERTDRKITEVSDHIRERILVIDEKIAATLDAVDSTGARVRHAVLAPVRSFKALTTGIQTGINTYRQRSREADGEWIDVAEEELRYHSEAEAPESRRPFPS